MTVYIGTYTGPKSKGIYRYSFDSDLGILKQEQLAATISNPSFLAIHPTKPLLYSVNEGGNFNGQKVGSISAFAIDADGGLRLLNQQASEGLWPCHLSLTPSADAVMAANYGSGTIAAFPIAADGQLLPAASRFQHEGKTGPTAKRQEKAHAHSITPSPGGQFALAADLGLDKVIIYRIASNGVLTRHSECATAAGEGPRHLDFHPNGKVVYVISELGNTMASYAWDESAGQLRAITALTTLPAGFTGQSACADVHVHPTGKFVYGSNRGHDSIVVYRTDESGDLILAGHQSTMGKHPRNFSLDPSGNYLIVANKDSDNLVVFRIDRGTGLLQHASTAEAPSPVCVRFARR